MNICIYAADVAVFSRKYSNFMLNLHLKRGQRVGLFTGTNHQGALTMLWRPYQGDPVLLILISAPQSRKLSRAHDII